MKNTDFATTLGTRNSKWY